MQKQYLDHDRPTGTAQERAGRRLAQLAARSLMRRAEEQVPAPRVSGQGTATREDSSS